MTIGTKLTSVQMQRSISAFAGIASIFLLCSFAVAQEKPDTAASGIPKEKSTVITVDSVLNKADAAAVGFALKRIDAINKSEFTYFDCDTDKGCLSGFGYRFVPEININAGDDGSFQALNAKISGEFMINRIAGFDVDGDPIVANLRHVFPLSMGIETTRYFNSIAAIGEIGYVPYNPSLGSFNGKQLQLGFNPYFGIFLQGGYKFDTASRTLTGGSIDQSSEVEDAYVARVKAVFEMTLGMPKLPFVNENSNGKIITWARGWYDIANQDYYHSIGAIFRFEVPGQENATFDLKYENGSGAPNFNTGSQFTAGLSWAF